MSMDPLADSLSVAIQVGGSQILENMSTVRMHRGIEHLSGCALWDPVGSQNRNWEF